VQKQVWLLASALPRTAPALAALGFDTVVVHDDGSPMARRARTRIEASGPELGPERRSPDLVSRALVPPESVSTDWASLEGDALSSADPIRAIGPAARIFFPVRNRSAEAFRHPTPLLPSDLVLRWEAIDPVGGTPSEWTTPLRNLLPIALGAGASLPIDAMIDLPERGGKYRLTLARAAAPDRPLAVREIDVHPAQPPAGRTSSDLTLLRPDAAPLARIPTDETLLSFPVRNEGDETYRDPSPRALKRLRLEWVDPAGSVVDADRFVAWVSPVMPPGAVATIEVPIVPPAPGRYVARLVPALDGRGHALGSREVEVVAPSAS
jgi:hypothetical protein